ncbi:response regulator [Dactylosporangium sp. AC04546]|uniref:response regulator n=1 Tax=Dactylosporangium sp. AC04546 TaxID=2862460 RepID=UPI001EDD39B2|nr:response regulator [Dactylosporangium sp. AC04546]WVK78848.1 response regulator [Dactylosporangium sp. AC04546]
MTRVLIVDDDELLLRTLELTLATHGYQVRTATDVAGALAAADRAADLIVVDLGLPDRDGIAVVQGIRTTSSVPIIVLSARHAAATKVAALDAGADDYVTKPFGTDELLARMRAALRRAAPPLQTPTVSTSSFTLDLAAKRATGPGGAPVRLTPTEWHLLEVLARHRGALVEHRQLLNEVWGPQYETETNYLRVHFANLRRKLEVDPARPRHIITEPGIGYRLEL